MDKPTQSLATSVSDPKVVAGVLLELVAKVNRELRPNDTTLPTPTLDHHFDRDYGLDSLARVELIARIEKEFSTSVPEQAMAEAQSPRDILRALLKSAGGNAALRLTESVDVSAPIVASTPENAETLLEVLRWHVEQHPDRAHIQFYDDYTDGEIITYGGLWEGARAVAGGLQRRGLEPGESVALMLPTGKDYFFAFYGVVLAGAIPVPIYPPARRAQLEDHLRRQSSILRNCRASMLITLTAAKSVGHLLTSQVDSLRHISTVDDLTGLAAECEIVERRAQDIGFLQYTSGSTGDPKGVILTHANLLANIRGNGRALAVTSHDVFVSWLPLYHDMGLIGAWLGSLYHAPRLVIMPPLSFLSKPERWLRAIHRYGGTVSAAPNFAFELCLRRINDEDIDGVDLSRWRLIANGAEAISAATMTAFSARFAAYGLPSNAVFPVYGLAESSVGLTFSPVGRGMRVDRVDRNTLAVAGRAKPVPAETPESISRTVVSCGLPLPRHEIRVMDESNREVPERHIGRLQFRGPSATSGYYRNPQSTAGLIRDDWLESGDIAYIAAGELFLVARHKDLIIRAGRNIHPVELEDRIGELDGIRSGCVAVIGSPDVGSGTERLVVLAETRKQQAAARNRLGSEISELVTDIITAPPDDIVLVVPNTILKTSSGKIRRADCCRLYEEGRLGRSDRAVWLQIVRLVVAGVRPQLRRVTRWITMTAYAGYSWLVFSAVGIAAWVLAMLPLPRPTLWWMLNLATRGLRLATLTRLEIVGKFPRSGQACVFVANHQSYIDGPTLLAALPYPVSFLVKGELRQSSLLCRPLLQLGVRFIERFDNDQGIAQMMDAVECLQNSDPLFVFPEGTFKRMPGVLPFRMGAFTSAVAADVPVVPIAIQGSRSILRAGSWFPRRGRIKLTVGEAFSPSHYDSEWASALALRDYARAHILEHCDEPDLVHESNVVDQRS